MEDLEDIARRSDVTEAAVTSISARVTGRVDGGGVVQFRRRNHHQVQASSASAADDAGVDAVAAAETSTTSTPTTSTIPGAAPFRLDSQGLGGSSQLGGKVWLKTFGCAHNVADSETMAGVLAEAGFDVVGIGGGAIGRVGIGGGAIGRVGLSKDDDNSCNNNNNDDDDSENVADSADAWVINSCTVKGPSQAAVEKLVARAREKGTPVVVAGCVPQGEPRSGRLSSASLLGVRQLDRVAEVVSEALRGNVVRMTSVSRSLPSLELPRVRRNAHIEVVPLSTGCLGRCTYCKTVHARGKLGSYPLQALVARVEAASRDPRVREVWLSSEDTGAYGRDIGESLPKLLRALCEVLPSDGRTMLRVGMTNPPYVLSYLDELKELLGGGGGGRGRRGGESGGGGGGGEEGKEGGNEEPNSRESEREERPFYPIFKFLHVPVQSGSDAVLERMRREYTVAAFERVASAVVRDAGATLATDVIVGFPGETDDDARATVELLQRWKPRATHVSKFYPRPGTPAAKWERPPARSVAARSRAVAAAVDGFAGAWEHLVGTRQRVWVVDVATDGRKLVGHTRDYAQVLLARRSEREKRKKEENGGGGGDGNDDGDSNNNDNGDFDPGCLGAALGDVVDVDITSASRWSVRGKVVKIVVDGDEAAAEALRLEQGEEEEGGGEEEKVVPKPRRIVAVSPPPPAAAAEAAAAPETPPRPQEEATESTSSPPLATTEKKEEEEMEREAEEAKPLSMTQRQQQWQQQQQRHSLLVSPWFFFFFVAVAFAVVLASFAIASSGYIQSTKGVVVEEAE